MLKLQQNKQKNGQVKQLGRQADLGRTSRRPDTSWLISQTIRKQANEKICQGQFKQQKKTHKSCGFDLATPTIQTLSTEILVFIWKDHHHDSLHPSDLIHRESIKTGEKETRDGLSLKVTIGAIQTISWRSEFPDVSHIVSAKISGKNIFSQLFFEASQTTIF